MTETKPALTPLTLADVRVVEPDRDNADVFAPSETWWLACDKIAMGYSADDVAGLLHQLPNAEIDTLMAWWSDECASVWQDGTGRDALCPDLRLLAAVNRRPGRLELGLPLVNPETVLPLVDQNAKLRELLRAARDLIAEWQEVHVWGDDPIGEECNGTAMMTAIDEALGEEGAA